MSASFECLTRSPRSAREMFDSARDIGLHQQSQRSSGETATRGVTGGLIALGEEVTWRARHFGIVFVMTSRVTEFDSPRRFVDEQTHGPFASFHHSHEFESTGEGSMMTDRICFSAPLGILGRIAEKLVLTRYLRRLIEDRGRFLASL